MTLTSCIQWMNAMAGVAALGNAIELLMLSRPKSRSLRDDGIWRASSLSHEWGVLGQLLGTRAFVVLMLVQASAAMALVTAGGAAYAGVLCVTIFLSAVRFRGNVNGGSDAMLFTVLIGITIAQLDIAMPFVREAAVLYVAAQLTLSYLRAGLVKARQRRWWTGDALVAFLAMPAYGVPVWVSRAPQAMRIAGVAVIAFECVAPIAWFHPAAAAGFIALAIAFHTGAALVFGLNRFLLAWSAAMPALWYAAHRT